MRRFNLALLFVIASFVSVAHAAVLTGPVLNPSNGHQYYLLTQNTWTASQAEAVLLGGSLATVDDALENNWIYDTLTPFASGQKHLWIGLNDAVNDGTYVWAGGGTSSFRNWSPSEPNNGASGAEDYVHIVGTSFSNLVARQWNDNTNIGTGIGDLTVPHGVVEVVPEPTTALTLAMGCILSAFRRNRV